MDKPSMALWVFDF